IIECAINHKYWEAKGFYVIASGIAPECYGKTTNYSSVNMGPRYSSDGAVQYVIKQGISKIVFDQSNVPGTGYIAARPNRIAKAAKIPNLDCTDSAPIQDPKSVSFTYLTGGGKKGAVLMNLHSRKVLL